MERQHIFAGNNTSNGFIHFFHSIFNPYESEKIYILKGGSGVGKSSLIKKFATLMESQNRSVEYIHCSSDEESLDGIWVPDYKVAMLDGTAPHMIDPIIPGAVDTILNLGEYLNQSMLQHKRKEIIQIGKEKSNCYQHAYRYLQAAGIVHLETNHLTDDTIDIKKANSFKQKFLEKVFSQTNVTSHHFSRKLFSEAYTANGYINYTPTLYHNKKVWALIGKKETLTSELLELVAKKAQEMGYHIDEYFHPLLPHIRNHIYIYNLNILITSIPHEEEVRYEEKFELSHELSVSSKEFLCLQCEQNTFIESQLIDSAVQYLSKAKQHHMQLEEIYVDAMDFSQVNQCFQQLASDWKE